MRRCSALSVLLLTFPSLTRAGQIVCHFDSGRDAEVNDFGDRKATGEWALSPEGTGCPANPRGRALDAGEVGGLAHLVEIPVSPTTSLAQGTLEAWVKTKWDWQSDRDHHSFLYIKMEGGYWNSICLYHHGRMGEARTLAFNINDGVDNCITCPVEQLGWKEGEWHHIAASWTEHSEWLFADGKLVAKRLFQNPMSFRSPSSPLRICPPGLWGSPTAALIDEVRFSDRPLYVGRETIPLPQSPLPDALPMGILEAHGTRILASSTASPYTNEEDVPELHNGTFGETVWLDREGRTWARVDLPKATRVTAVRWSRDGRPLKGVNDWAEARNLPRDFAFEVTADGETWQTVVTRTDHYYDPDNIPRDGMVFEHRFAPVEARSVRITVTKGQPDPLGPRVALDELQVIGEDGKNVAREARVVTARTSFHREYRPEKVADGRLGEESCWRAAQPGEATLDLVLATPCEIKTLTWSRSAEGIRTDGTPKDLVVEAERDGQWVEVGKAEGNAEPGRHELALRPTIASRVRVRILATCDGREPIFDEITLR